MIDLKFSSTSLFSVAVCLLFLLIALPNHGNAQEEEVKTSRWELNLDLGIAEHDRRLGSPAARAAALQRQPDFFGTYTVTAGVQYQVGGNDKFKWSAGLNHVYSVSTFMRPWEDASWPRDLQMSEDFKWVDYYRELMVAPVVTFRLKAFKKVWVGTTLQARFRYHLKSKDRERVREYYDGPWKVGIRSVEAYADFTYMINDRFSMTGRYRVAQYHRNDLNLINSYTSGDSTSPKYEWFNPVKLVVGLSYRL
jgi:hypothetical protein